MRLRRAAGGGSPSVDAMCARKNAVRLNRCSVFIRPTVHAGNDLRKNVVPFASLQAIWQPFAVRGTGREDVT